MKQIFLSLMVVVFLISGCAYNKPLKDQDVFDLAEKAEAIRKGSALSEDLTPDATDEVIIISGGSNYRAQIGNLPAPTPASDDFTNIKEVYYVSNDAGISDHGDTGESGSLADVITNEIAGDDANVELPGNKTYTITTNYTVPKTVTLNMQRGAMFDGAGTLTLSGGPDQIRAQPDQQIFGSSITIVSSINGTWHPGWFGFAEAASAATNATALQAALDMAKDGGILLLPSGTFSYNSTLTGANSVIIRGHGRGTDDESATKLLYTATDSSDAMSFTGTGNDHSTGDPVVAIALEHFWLEGNASCGHLVDMDIVRRVSAYDLTLKTAGGNIVNIGQAHDGLSRWDNMEFRAVAINGGVHGIYLGGGGDFLFSGGSINGYTGYGIWVEDSALVYITDSNGGSSQGASDDFLYIANSATNNANGRKLHSISLRDVQLEELNSGKALAKLVSTGTTQIYNVDIEHNRATPTTAEGVILSSAAAGKVNYINIEKNYLPMTGAGTAITIGSNVERTIIKDNKFGSGGTDNISDSGDLTVINGLGQNVGDPNSTGDWHGEGNEGDRVYDTTNEIFWNYTGSAWERDKIGTSKETVTIADDDFTSFTPPDGNGVLIVVTAATDGENKGGIALFHAAGGDAGMADVSGGSKWEVITTAGTLDGTTGTDTYVIVRANTDLKIYLENRSGASRTFSYTIID